VTQIRKTVYDGTDKVCTPLIEKSRREMRKGFLNDSRPGNTFTAHMTLAAGPCVSAIYPGEQGFVGPELIDPTKICSMEKWY
jgi:hypothetical protein